MTAPTKSEAELEAMSEQNQINPPFLRHPSEIRNPIYHLAFGGHEIYAMPNGHRPFVCMGRPNNQFAWNLKPIAQIMAIHLPLVCRQIRFEVGKCFAFDFSSFGSTIPEYFALLMSKLTAEQKNRIEIVTVNFTYVDPPSNGASMGHYSPLQSMRNLKVVVLRDIENLSSEREYHALKRLRNNLLRPDLDIRIVKI
jgi:hypothetical protein